MLVRELEEFRDRVAIPRMQKLLDSITIPEGMCCIDNLDISFYDGRSCGTDSEIKASGLRYQNGKVEAYQYDEYDVSVGEFAAAHNDCVFISDGKLCIWNELEETEIRSLIRNLDSCAQLFPELKESANINIRTDVMEYVKMQHLYKTEAQREPLSDKLQSADARAAGSLHATDTKSQSTEHEF